MWKDNDDRIMNILDKVETRNKECFPVSCPICGKRDGHLYFHRNKESDTAGGMWTWCSTCQHSAHSWYRLPKWWKNLEEIDFEKLASYPDYLEKNKMIIDEWLNKFVSDFMGR